MNIKGQFPALTLAFIMKNVGGGFLMKAKKQSHLFLWKNK